MPPAGMPRPAEPAVDAFLSWLQTELDASAARHPNPGRPETLHRLNCTEYRNAIRDLLSLDLDVAHYLPADDSSYRFDNIGGALKMSQSLPERYLAAGKYDWQATAASSGRTRYGRPSVTHSGASRRRAGTAATNARGRGRGGL